MLLLLYFQGPQQGICRTQLIIGLRTVRLAAEAQVAQAVSVLVVQDENPGALYARALLRAHVALFHHKCTRLLFGALAVRVHESAWHIAIFFRGLDFVLCGNFSNFPTHSLHSRYAMLRSYAMFVRRALDPMITENVKRKVSVVGSDKSAIKKLFLEELHEEVSVCKLCTTGG